MSPAPQGRNTQPDSSFTRASCLEDYFNILIRLRLLLLVNPKGTDAYRLSVPMMFSVLVNSLMQCSWSIASYRGMLRRSGRNIFVDLIRRRPPRRLQSRAEPMMRWP